MILGEPPNTEYDLKFKLGTIPVRVHPYFWLVTLLMGLNSRATSVMIALWIAAVFVSILLHELGHALAARYFGWPPRIVLHGFGGLAIFQPRRRDPRADLLISLAGPAAGFAFALVVLLLLALTGRLPTIGVDTSPIFMMFGIILSVGGDRLGFAIHLLVLDLMYINIIWGLINLLPVYPLDGGQSLRSILQILRQPDPDGVTYQVSVATGILMAVLFVMWGEFYPAIMFGYLAFQSWQMLKMRSWQRWN